VNTIPRLLAVVLVAALAGCATADFTPYVGAQQNWPTAPGSFVKVVNSYDGPGRSGTGKQYTLPVYFGPPNRRYTVLGSVDVDTPVGRLFEDSEQIATLKPAVRKAGQHGADAIIVVAQNVETRGYSTASVGNFSSNTSFSGNYGNGFFAGNANTTGSSFDSSITAPNRRGKARVIAIKFL